MRIMTNDAVSATSRYPSPRIWGPASRMTDMRDDPVEGFGYFDDFDQLLVAQAVCPGWTVTRATDGDIAGADGDGGVITITPAGTAAGRGIQMQLGSGAAYLPEAGYKLRFEIRCKIDALTNAPELFFGFHGTDTSIFSGGVINSGETESFVGFYMSRTAGQADLGALAFASSKAGVEKLDYTGHTFVADTYAKLGFVVDGVTSTTIYVNGTALTTGTTSTYTPTVVMRPSIVCQDSGTTSRVLTIDWVKASKCEK